MTIFAAQLAVLRSHRSAGSTGQTRTPGAPKAGAVEDARIDSVVASAAPPKAYRASVGQFVLTKAS